MSRSFSRFATRVLLATSVLLPALARADGYEVNADDDTQMFVPGYGNFDRNYTFGTRWARYGEPDVLPDWAERAAARLDRGAEGATHRYGLAFGQELYTPDHLSSPLPDAHDRPYAAWMYGSAFVASATATHERVLELRAGVVGPMAKGEQVQTEWHRFYHVRLPRGWRWQLHNEPGVIATAQERWRPFGTQRFADAVPHVRVSLGTITTEAAAGLTLRAGAPLPDDFGPGMTTTPGTGGSAGPRARRFNGYVFARTEGRYVARDEFLDGNLFGGSMHVTRVPWVGESQLGAGVRWRSVGLRYAFSYTTMQFRERAYPQEYGSFGISF